MSKAKATVELRSGLEPPEAGAWSLDTAHTAVSFVARHLMISKVRGRFNQAAGSVTIAERPEDSSVDVVIGAVSIDTGNDMRDNHLRSPDFLDVERFPEIRYRSTAVEQSGETSLRVTGDLTIRDVTHPVLLNVEYVGLADGPMGPAAGFSAWAEIDREDWGITWNQALETGGVLVGKKVRIEIEAEIRPEKG
jgi:polyisoprenoid-binding protein YceI